MTAAGCANARATKGPAEQTLLLGCNVVTPAEHVGVVPGEVMLMQPVETSDVENCVV